MMIKNKGTNPKKALKKGGGDERQRRHSKICENKEIIQINQAKHLEKLKI